MDKIGDTTAEVLDRRRRKVEAEKIIGTPTLSKFIEDRYSGWMEANTRRGTAQVERIQRAFADLLDKPLAEFNAWIIEKWRAARLKSGKTPATANRDIAALRGLFSRALEWGVISEHPLAKVKALREPSGVVRWLSDAEELRLRAALDAREERERAGRDSANKWRAERDYQLLPDLRKVSFTDYLKPAVLVSMNTGLRQGELLRLEWKNVDLDRAQLTVTDETAKSGKQRHVPLNAEALSTLKAWSEQSRGEIVFEGDTGGVRSGPKTAWASLLKVAKITDFRWHDMRHSFASRLVMAGVDLNVVRELLGHADLTMTLRYAHLAPEHKAAAVEKLNRMAIEPSRKLANGDE